MTYRLTALETRHQLAFKADGPTYKKLERMMEAYPLITKTQWLNAAMNYYLDDCIEHGVDKYLTPLATKKPRKPAA